MQEAAENLEFEKAAEYRELLYSVRTVSYTHLDVYKRQICWLSSTFFHSKNPP